MLEALTDLKNNKVRKTSGGPEVVGRMKKFLSGLGRAQHRMYRLFALSSLIPPSPLQ